MRDSRRESPGEDVGSGGEKPDVDRLPPWIPEDAVRSELETVCDRQEAVIAAREAYLDHLANDDLESAVSAKRDYQLAVYKRRQAEGEVLWVALGHAIADVAETASPEDEAVTKRGESFVDWAIDADPLRSIRDRDRVHLEIARRSPTLPSGHAPYVESMFDLEKDEIAALRERDRKMLERAGWRREGRSGERDVVLDCPHCGDDVVVRAHDGERVTVAPEFEGVTDEMREICPHCERNVFVVIGSE